MNSGKLKERLETIKLHIEEAIRLAGSEVHVKKLLNHIEKEIQSALRDMNKK
jgi:hypothetical protein